MSTHPVVLLGMIGTLALAGSLGSCAAGTATAHQSASAGPAVPPASAAPDPAKFVRTVDNPYYPLPVGRVLVYKGLSEGKAQTDTVTVTPGTKVIEGVHVVVVRDVTTDVNHRVLEATTDWYAQDVQGNVWYFGEDTKAYDEDGTADPSGSWIAGVGGATPGLIMEAHPQIPDAYRQEYLKGQAEDTAWIIGTDGTARVPYGTVHHTVRTLEASALEPEVIEEKVYAPHLGVVSERSLTGPAEMSLLVSVTG